MLVNALTSPLIADSGAIAVWTITALLTCFLIGLPALYLLVLILADDDNGFDRRVREIEQYLKATERAHAARDANLRSPSRDCVAAPGGARDWPEIAGL
jgi:hypothetical protein